MTSYEQRVSLLEFLYRKPGVNLPDVPKDPQNLECLIRDVFDELQRSRAQLCEQVTALETRNRELEEYAHMVAHDLKEPLTVLIMTADLIKDIPDLTVEERREDLQEIKSTAYQMKDIIKSLLLFAEVSKAEAPRGAVQMARVVANVQARLSYMIREQQAQLILPQVWPDAVGYGPWIEEVWANFLSNALKYGGRPPRVELGASPRSDGMLRFWTRDNGPGIPPEARSYLFTRGNPLSRLGQVGDGLGLPIVHNIVEKLGGEVGVESEVGQGSLFYFTLPAAASQSASVDR
ncbi:MAG TPA: HAMP domain-containing sensor histidine kinase [Anaerolineales bacterium]|nr:HAMP domain-containing sensor histidine kinase [Anaerolineales bacterium]